MNGLSNEDIEQFLNEWLNATKMTYGASQFSCYGDEFVQIVSAYIEKRNGWWRISARRCLGLSGYHYDCRVVDHSTKQVSEDLTKKLSAFLSQRTHKPWQVIHQ